MKKITFLLLFFCWHGLAIFAQQEDITGMWNGELLMTDSAGELIHLPYEIAVSEEKGKLKGYSRIVQMGRMKRVCRILPLTRKEISI